MEYGIKLNVMNYILALSGFGIIGSCYGAYKETGETRPFLARVVTGFFAGSITLLTFKMFKLTGHSEVHFGASTILGLLAEKGDIGKIIDYQVKRFKGEGK